MIPNIQTEALTGDPDLSFTTHPKTQDPSHHQTSVPHQTSSRPTTKPSVYNQGCKHFCTQETLVTAPNTKTETLPEDPDLSFTTHPKTQDLPPASTSGERPLHESRNPCARRCPLPQSAAQAGPGAIRPAARKAPLSSGPRDSQAIGMCMDYI